MANMGCDALSQLLSQTRAQYTGASDGLSNLSSHILAESEQHELDSHRLTVVLEFDKQRVMEVGEIFHEQQLAALQQELPCVRASWSKCTELECKVDKEQKVTEFLDVLVNVFKGGTVRLNDKTLVKVIQNGEEELLVGCDDTFEELRAAQHSLRLQVHQPEDKISPLHLQSSHAVFTGTWILGSLCKLYNLGDILFVAGLGALFEGSIHDWLKSMTYLKVEREDLGCVIFIEASTMWLSK